MTAHAERTLTESQLFHPDLTLKSLSLSVEGRGTVRHRGALRLQRRTRPQGTFLRHFLTDTVPQMITVKGSHPWW